MIYVYDGRDEVRAGHGLGAIHPSECVITEETGGGYELSMTLPLMRDWNIVRKGHVIRAKGAPHRESSRMQDFRVYLRELTDDGLAVRIAARHVFYDGVTSFVTGPVEMKEQPVSDALSAMMEASDQVPFALDVSDDAGEYSGSMVLVNWVNALLAPETGLIAGARLRIERDGMVVRLRKAGGAESGLRLKWGRNVMGIGMSSAVDQVVTRLKPVGENSDGSLLFLPEVHIDSPRISEYWQPLVSMWKVAGAKVGQKVRREDGTTAELTVEEVQAMLRDAAAERLRSGCDLPTEKMSVAYVDMRQSDEEQLKWASANVCLYDWCHVIHEADGVDEKVQVTGYTWDVLRQRYSGLEVGDAFRDRTETAIVTSPQLRKEAQEAQGRSLRVADLVDIAADEIRMQARQIELIAYDFENLDQRTSQAEIRLDGLDGQITLLGTKVTDQGDTINQVMIDLNAAEAAILLKAEKTTVDGLDTRVSDAEIAIDAANSSLLLKASLAELERESSRITDVSARLDALSGEIELKVSQNSFTNLEGRVSAAESSILLNTEGITSKVSKDGIISAINQTAEAVKIAARLIELEGSTVVQSLSGLRIDVSYVDGYGADLQELYLQGQFVDMTALTMGDVVNETVWGLGGEISLQHSHEVGVDNSGKLQLGGVTAEGSGGNFNLADTQYYKDGVSAAYGNGYLKGQSDGKDAYMPTAINRTGYDTAAKTVIVRALNSHQDLLTGVAIDASEIYGAGDSAGYARGELHFKPTHLWIDRFDPSTKTIYASTSNDTQMLITEKALDGAYLYNAGWNDCIQAAKDIGNWTNMCQISSYANGTLYARNSDGTYYSVGSSWVMVNAISGVFYKLPATK